MDMVNIAGGVHQNVKCPKIIHFLVLEREALLVCHKFLYHMCEAWSDYACLRNNYFLAFHGKWTEFHVPSHGHTVRRLTIWAIFYSLRGPRVLIKSEVCWMKARGQVCENTSRPTLLKQPLHSEWLTSCTAYRVGLLLAWFIFVQFIRAPILGQIREKYMNFTCFIILGAIWWFPEHAEAEWAVYFEKLS